jgi:hypothetical protein
MTKEVVVMGPDPGDVQPGIAVVSSDGRYIGTIKAIQEAEFLVDRGFWSQVNLPLSAVQDVTSAPLVLLSISQEAVAELDW